jgi:hypothetical protein
MSYTEDNKSVAEERLPAACATFLSFVAPRVSR